MAFTLQIIIDALSLGSFYALAALAALGIGLLFGVLRLINFAHGDFITVGAFALIVPSLAAESTMFIGNFHFIPLIVTIIVIVVVLALISEFAVFKPLRDASPATLMIGSFALGYIIQNLIIMFYGGRPKAVGLWSSLNQGITLMEGVQVPQLQMPVSVFQRQMHQKNGEVVHFEFDNQSLYTGIEIVKCLAMNPGSGKKRVTLFSNDGQHLIERFCTVLDFV